jgi:hypothetical protein
MKPIDLEKEYGSKANIARALKTKYTRVANWFYRDEIPLSAQYEIQIITHGKLKADKK